MDSLHPELQFIFRSETGEIEYDGVTMLRLIHKTIDPSTLVGFDSVLKKIEQSCLSNHNNCVKEMLTMIKSH